MKALCVTSDRTLAVRDVPAPGAPPPEHLVVRMEACTINPGDKFFLRAPPLRAAPRSSHDVWGASGAGTVVAVGSGVPPEWVGRKVAVYRSLWPSPNTLGTWCELAQLPMRTCALIPEGLAARDYSGSLVNVITAYAFAKQALAEGHRDVLITAGSSATGVALAGLAAPLGLSALSLVRSGRGKQRLLDLGVANVLAQEDASFEVDLRADLERRGPTAVFDAVGGPLISRLIPQLPVGSTVSSYGYLGGYDSAIQVPTLLLLTKGLTLRGFSNFASATVKDPQNLDAALRHLGELLALPHCKTTLGRTYAFEQIDEAIAAVGNGSEGKPVLVPA